MHRIEPHTPEQLFRRLDELTIAHSTIEHPPVFTVDEAKRLRGTIPGAHVKNLFLRDKKGVMWLVVCLEDRQVDLAWLSSQLGCKRLSFGSAERLWRTLGVEPGSVTPFGIINDRGREVGVALDRALLTYDPLNFHPLVNDKTTSISAPGLTAFLEAEGHPPLWVDFDRMQTA
ncbi:MAG: prolyl-tRNA synthetase associated domain-containing protein [Gemmatimonadota bacterium]